jgi:hypothetical protein
MVLREESYGKAEKKSETKNEEEVMIKKKGGE